MANIKAYAKLEDLFEGESNLTNNSKFDLGTPTEEDGVYIFTKTIDIPYTTWHYEDHQCAVEVEAINIDNNNKDNKDRTNYSSNTELDGLFRAKENEAPKVTSIIAEDENNSIVGLVESYIHQNISTLELIASDKNAEEWFKNSGIKDDDGGTLKSLEMLKIYKDDEENDLFNPALLTRTDDLENRTTKWVYGTEGEKIFGDGKWKIVFKISDNDGNSTAEKIYNFIIDTVAPTLNIISQIPPILDKTTFDLVGQTEPNLRFTTIVNGESQTDEQLDISNEDGAFTKRLNLKQGKNTITILVYDLSGLESSVTIEIQVDTTIPVIESVKLSPITTEVGSGKLTITVRVSM